MRRLQFLLFPLLLLVLVVFGTAYAGALLSWVMGPWTAVGIEQDGSQTHFAFGQNLPRPDWVPVYPGATVVQASTLTSAKMPSGVHSLELATRAPFDDVKRFYLDRLTEAGFEVEDHGIAPLNPATAAYLGVAGSLSGKRVDSDDIINVMIRTPDGLIPSRVLQIHWRKLSELPTTVGQQPAAAGQQ